MADELLQSRIGFSESYRKDIAAEAAKNNHELWITARLFAASLSQRFTTSANPIALYELDLHDLWYTYIEAAKTTDADDPAQDRLVCQILAAREKGTLVRLNGPPDHGNQDTETAITSNGIIWDDVPYLVADLHEFWTRQSPKLSRSHRVNLAAFTARLIATNVAGPRLSICALWLLTHALELSRPTTEPVDQESFVPLVDILEALNACLRYCSQKLLLMCSNKYSPLPLADEITEGALDRRDISDQMHSNGLSFSKWVLWKDRLKILCEHDSVKVYALRCLNIMDSTERELGPAFVPSQA